MVVINNARFDLIVCRNIDILKQTANYLVISISF